MFDPRAAARQARSLEHVGHRPWLLPERPWTMAQTWEDVLLAHWPVPADALRMHVPEQLELDIRDASAWLGVVPFRLTGLRSRGLLPLPGVSGFLEVNVRTLVRDGEGRPGVWFLSLDASNRLVVAAARRLYHLPYFHARMSLQRRGEWVEYESARLGADGSVFSGRYRPTGDAFAARQGSLEEFLVERYCLFALDGEGRLRRGDIHHAPWELQPAEAQVGLASIVPLDLSGEPSLLFVRRQDVVVWQLDPAG